MDLDCESACKFCFIHQYGVYALNLSGLLIFLLLVRMYWSEVVASWTGKSKPLLPTSGSDSREKCAPVVTNYQQNTPIYAQSPVIVPQTAEQYALPKPTPAPAPAPAPTPSDKPNSLDRSFNKRSINKKTKRPLTPAEKLLLLLKKKEKKQQQLPVPSPDPFKLPTPDPRDVIAETESTGSNYYKQMMKGKKPVASVSQYLDKNRHKDKAKTKDITKRHQTKRK